MSDYLLKDTESKRKLQAWLRDSMLAYASDSHLKWNDEDSLCEHFFASIGGMLTTPNGTLNVSSYKVRGRGPGAAEKKLGADGIGLVSIHTSNTNLTGFFLFQAKKSYSQSTALTGAKAECSKMLNHSAASYLLTLMPTEVKMVGAMAVHSFSGNNPSLSDVPFVGFPRFVVEHLLQGVMLEPMARAYSWLTPVLRSEIKHVLTVIGGRGQQIEEAMIGLESEIKEMGLDVER